MNIDPMAEFKIRQRETWTMGNFGGLAVFTTPVAGHLVRYAGVVGGQALQSDSARLAAWRNEMDKVVSEYLHDNIVRHEYLLTRAIKV